MLKMLYKLIKKSKNLKLLKKFSKLMTGNYNFIIKLKLFKYRF